MPQRVALRPVSASKSSVEASQCLRKQCKGWLVVVETGKQQRCCPVLKNAVACLLARQALHEQDNMHHRSMQAFAVWPKGSMLTVSVCQEVALREITQ